MRRSTATREKAELTGLAHGAERKEGRSGQRLDDWRSGPARQRERERERAVEKNGHRQISPTGQRARESECARVRASAADRRGPPVRGGRHAGARPGGA
jgi:hypothetical protein